MLPSWGHRQGEDPLARLPCLTAGDIPECHWLWRHTPGGVPGSTDLQGALTDPKASQLPRTPTHPFQNNDLHEVKTDQNILVPPSAWAHPGPSAPLCSRPVNTILEFPLVRAQEIISGKDPVIALKLPQLKKRLVCGARASVLWNSAGDYDKANNSK